MKKRLILPLLCLLLFCACTSSPADAEATGYTVPVSLVLPEGAAVAGDALIYVAPGEDAVFAVALSPGYTMVVPDGCTYSDGVLTLHDVRYPATITPVLQFDPSAWIGTDPGEIPTGASFAFATAGETGGSVTVSHPDGSYPAGTKIAVSAAADDDYRFVCWSVGSAAGAGGVPVSTAAEYEFLLGMPLTLYANFAPAYTATILYDANGGAAVDGGYTFLREDSDLRSYYTPRTMRGDGRLTREGYVLYAYNTAPDGNGTEYTFGANLPIGHGETATLYAMWAPVDESCFTWETVENGVRITGCRSDAERIVIPAEIEGKPVVSIAAGAIADLPNLRTLISNPAVRDFASGAIQNCPNFTTLYLCDTVRNIPDDVAKGCPAFCTLKLGAVREPTYLAARIGSYCIKFQRLIIADKPRVIVVSGSSSTHGFSTPLFDELLEEKYHVVNYGISQSNPSSFFLELIAAFARPGDIVIVAPEPHYQQLGGNTMSAKTWQSIEGAMECLSYVDLRNYTNVFSTLTDFNKTRDKMDPVDYAAFDAAGELNRYGEHARLRPNRTNENYVVSAGSISLDPAVLTAERAERLNACFARLRERGAEVYFSFAPMNINALAPTSATARTQERYVKTVDASLTAIRISELDDYFFSGIYISDSDLHLNSEGQIIRTQRLAADLIAQLTKEGRWN